MKFNVTTLVYAEDCNIPYSRKTGEVHEVKDTPGTFCCEGMKAAMEDYAITFEDTKMSLCIYGKEEWESMYAYPIFLCPFCGEKIEYEVKETKIKMTERKVKNEFTTWEAIPVDTPPSL